MNNRSHLQPSIMDWHTARSLSGLTGCSMKPHASARNRASSMKASAPTQTHMDFEAGTGEAATSG